MAKPRTIGGLWQAAVERNATGAGLLTREGDQWRRVEVTDAAARVDSLAHGLLARGLVKGDAVGILARTTVEWALLDFALARIGAVTAPIYPTSSAADVTHILDNSDARLIICEDDEQLEKVNRAALPALREALLFEDLPALEREGAAHRDTDPDAVEVAAAAVAEDDLYTFIYTSGTTGPPKGCRISHRNYVAMVESVVAVEEFDLERGGDVILLFLPLAHNFGRLTHLFGARIGAAVAYEPDPYAVSEALLAVRPTILPSVPRIYEKIHATVGAAFAEATGVRRLLIRWALGVGATASARRAAGTLPPGARLGLAHALARKLVFSKVHARLGGRLRLAISGGAPLAPEIGEFFDRLDLPIYEGYGLTEATSASTVNRPGRTRYGTVGPVLPGVEARLADDGELLLRGETVFAGYHKDAVASAEVLGDDGWLRTGDIAEIDEDGFVRITDRKKDIIVTAGGKNIAPQNIENELKLAPYVSQALVVGDRRPFPAALLTLDSAAIEPWAASHGLPTDVATLAGLPEVHALLQQSVDSVNAGRARFEQVKRFAVLPRDFQMNEGEVTPTLKLRRRAIMQRFAAEIDALYADSE